MSCWFSLREGGQCDFILFTLLKRALANLNHNFELKFISRNARNRNQQTRLSDRQNIGESSQRQCH